MKENIIKATFSVALGALCAYFGELIIPLIMLFVAMIGDYISGMVKAYMTSTLSSKTGIKGIVKKVCYLLIACVGFFVDWIIMSTTSYIGMEIELPAIFGMIVIIWLIINELISILENLSIVGVPMPKFLVNIVNKLKVTVEQTGGKESEKGNE